MAPRRSHRCRQVHRPGHDHRRTAPRWPTILQDRLNALNDLAPHAQARPLERRRPALHRRPRDARPAGRRRAGDDRRDGRAHRHPRRGAAAARPARSSPPAPGTTTTSAGPAPSSTSARSTLVYTGVIESHRKAIDATEDPDPVTQDMLIGQAGAARAVPLVRAGPPRELRRRAVDGRRDAREDGGQEGRRAPPSAERRPAPTPTPSARRSDRDGRSRPASGEVTHRVDSEVTRW